MVAASVIGIMTLVLSVLVAVLGEFPGPTAAGDKPSTSVTDVKSGAEEVGARFTSGYTWVVNDLVSYIDKVDQPDLGRAERQQQAMVNYANNAATQFRGLADNLKQELDKTTKAASDAAIQPTN